MTDPRDGEAMTERAWTDVLAYTGAEWYDHITADEVVGALVAKGWRPPPSGDVVEQAASVLRYRMEDIGLVQEIEGEDGGEIYDGERTYVEAGHILARHLADDGLLAAPGEFISIPVPQPDELVERVAKAIAGAHAEPASDSLAADEWERLGQVGDGGYRGRFRSYAHAALRALGEATP